MAKVTEEFVLIRLSKLTKSDTKTGKLIDDGLYAQLEEVVSELVGDGSVIIEVEPFSLPDEPETPVLG